MSQCVKALVYYDLHVCRLNIQNDKGDTPLHIAARWGYEGIIEVLLQNGASTTINNKVNDSPLKCALNSKVRSRDPWSQLPRPETHFLHGYFNTRKAERVIDKNIFLFLLLCHFFKSGPFPE